MHPTPVRPTPVVPGTCAASALVGARPGGALARVSLAVRALLLTLAEEGGAAVLVAVSGGADSLALAVTAIDQCVRLGVPVHTLTVDHGLRHGSAREAADVARVLGSLGARATWTGVEVGQGGGPEGAARDARRQALRGHAMSLLGDDITRVAILLGHTMDDQAETVLLRLARGSGSHSLRAMSATDPEGPLLWARPLLGTRRADTRAACRQMGVAWVEDPTNAPDGPWRASDGSALRRSAVRTEALPALARALGQDPVPALARSARLLARDDAALSELASDLLRRTLAEGNRGQDSGQEHPGGCAQGHPGDGRPRLLVGVGELERAAPAVRERALRRALLRAGARPGSLSATHIEAVDALVTAWHGQGPLDLPGVGVARRMHPGGAVLEMTSVGGNTTAEEYR